MLSAKLFVNPPQDNRNAARLPHDVAATMRDFTEQPVIVTIRDLSPTGARFACDYKLEIGETVRLGITGLGVQNATIVHRNGGYGCTFERPLSPDLISAAKNVETVVPFNPTAVRRVVLDPKVSRYPRLVRVALLAGGSVIGWWTIITLLQ